MSAEKDVQKELLKLYAYGSLASLWVNLGTQDAIDEDDAGELLRLQNSLIKQFDTTLQAHLDEFSMQAFRHYVDTYRVRVSQNRK